MLNFFCTFKWKEVKSVFNYSKLRGRIVEKYGSINSFAKKAGISDVSMSKKLNNKAGISREEILKWSELLDIQAEDYGAYFFAKQV